MFEVTFSPHAQERMVQRQIKEDDVYTTLFTPFWIEHTTSTSMRLIRNDLAVIVSTVTTPDYQKIYVHTVYKIFWDRPEYDAYKNWLQSWKN
jgi:hypothetical protein